MDYDLRPGDILLFKKKDGFDPVGSFITAQERDTNTCHAAMIGKTGNIWTTGAIKHFGCPIFYGSVSPETYLAGRDFTICRFINLTESQLGIMEANSVRMTGMIYGFHKVLLLIQKSKFGGVVRRLYPWLTKEVKHPFCSEAVSDSCWKANLPVCQSMGKEEPSAITPANLYQYALMKGSPLNIVQEIDQ